MSQSSNDTDVQDVDLDLRQSSENAFTRAPDYSAVQWRSMCPVSGCVGSRTGILSKAGSDGRVVGVI